MIDAKPLAIPMASGPNLGMKQTRLLSVSLLAAFTPVAFATWDTNDETVQKLVTVGKSQNRAYTQLEYFTSKFGPRLTGSPQLYNAQQWAAAEFKKFGLQNVQIEKWGEIPVGFYRGPRQVAKMTAPWKIDFQFTTPAWTPGTKGKIKVKPLLQPETMEEFKAMEPKLKDAWILMSRPRGMRGPAAGGSEEQRAVEEALSKSGIAGRIYGTADERVHTGGRFTGLEWDKLPTEANLIVRKSDFNSISVALKTKRDVELELDIENHFVKGPVPQYNVIAELPGTDLKDEIVIICGHFDSWNGPGSVGANDNGTGSTVTLEAARLLSKVGAKPRRTIRFILWSGEEQGLLGSKAYVQMHKDEMPKISAVFNDDGGTNYQGGYQCIESMVPMLKAAYAPVEKAFPELPMTVNVSPAMPRGGSSDHASFNQVGVPGFFSIEAGKADYGFVWHTQNDTPKHSIPEYLVQSSTNAAVVAYNIANAPTMLPRQAVPAGGFIPAGPPAGGSRNYYHDHSHDDPDHDHYDEYVDYVFDFLLRRIVIWP